MAELTILKGTSLNPPNVEEKDVSPSCNMKCNDLSDAESTSGEESDQTSLSSYGFKLLEKDCCSQTNDLSQKSSSCSTRRNSLHSESDLEVPFHLLFNSSSSSSSSRSRETPIQPSEASNILNGIDLLVHRLTSERFLELRRIQLGERPVTGSNARENLENFFHRAIHGPSNEEQLQLEEENRPGNIVSDVERLLEQGLVRTSLETGFHERLERSLLSRRVAAEPQRIIQTQQRQHSQPVNQHSSISNTFRSNLERMLSDRIGTNTIPARTLVNAPAGTTSSRAPINNGRPSLSTTNQLPPVNRSNEQGGSSSNLQITIESDLQLLTESITEDLTRLQSLQVVSNMLRGDFRHDLEDLVRQNVSIAGNGENVQSFVQSLPRTRRPQYQSARGETRPTQSTASINIAVSNEMNDLRRQLDEMKRMMAMSMEIQMDTQRAIKQEVSAIFASLMQQHLNTNQAAGTETTDNRPTVVRPTFMQPYRNTTTAAVGQCVICVDRSIDSVLYQCGHMCVCNQCGLQLKIDGHHCPMCRAPIRDVIRAYQAQ